MDIQHAAKAGKHTVGRPVGSDGKQTVVRIVDCARICFASKGFAATTFKDVAREAGLTHAALYKYFGSKAELYAATFNQTTARLVSRIDQVVATEMGFKARIKGILRECAKLVEDDPDSAAFLMTALLEQSRNPEIKPDNISLDLAILNNVLLIIEEARTNAEIPADTTAEDIFLAFLGSGLGIIQVQQSGGMSSASSAIETFIAIIESRFFSDN